MRQNKRENVASGGRDGYHPPSSDGGNCSLRNDNAHTDGRTPVISDPCGEELRSEESSGGEDGESRRDAADEAQ